MDDPFNRFERLFARASKEEAADPTSAALATADISGHPSVRMVLIKSADENGFVFYSNYSSRKARELTINPRGALCYNWPAIKVQVRIEGMVESMSDEESDAYFATRPRKSQLAAWASMQSAPLPGRAWLLARFLRYALRYTGQTVPRPPIWGGYRLIPDRIEFWYDQPHRLHERLLYVREGEDWRMQRLYP